jgi:hypothetical protein
VVLAHIEVVSIPVRISLVQISTQISTDSYTVHNFDNLFIIKHEKEKIFFLKPK